MATQGTLQVSGFIVQMTSETSMVEAQLCISL